MLENTHQFVLEFFKEDGTKLGQTAVEVDWEPAREWTRFYAVRRGLLPVTETAAAASVKPLWDRSAGEPYICGFRLSIAANGSGEVAEDFPVRYFRGLARQACSYFVEKGKLQGLDHFQYLVTAYATGPASSPDSSRIESEELAPALTYHDSALAGFIAGAVPQGTMDIEDMPLFIPRAVLDEAAESTRLAAGREVGGVLIGNLHHDSGLPEIFAEVTAQIAAKTLGDMTKLTFNEETWMAARSAIRLRNRNELYLGYWHSHPVREWCKAKACHPEKVRNCSLAKDYFSADDELVLRTAFGRAHNVGLVCNDAPLSDLTFSLFGWRRGLIEPRGYYILGGEHAA